MLALVQRVKSGSVKLSKHKEKIESGLVIFVCLEDTDTESTFLKFGQKMAKALGQDEATDTYKVVQ